MHVDTDLLIDTIKSLHPQAGNVHWFDSIRACRPLLPLQMDLMRRPDVAFHAGVLRNGGGNWHQKQVDSMIVMLLNDLAMYGHQSLSLIAGDEDLVPGIQAARQWGCSVNLLTMKEDDKMDFDPMTSIVAQECSSVRIVDDPNLAAAIRTAPAIGKAAAAMVAMMASVA